MGNGVHDENCPWAADNLPDLAARDIQELYTAGENERAPEPLPREDVQPDRDGSWFGEMDDIWDNTISQ